MKDDDVCRGCRDYLYTTLSICVSTKHTSQGRLVFIVSTYTGVIFITFNIYMIFVYKIIMICKANDIHNFLSLDLPTSYIIN